MIASPSFTTILPFLQLSHVSSSLILQYDPAHSTARHRWHPHTPLILFPFFLSTVPSLVIPFFPSCPFRISQRIIHASARQPRGGLSRHRRLRRQRRRPLASHFKSLHTFTDPSRDSWPGLFFDVAFPDSRCSRCSCPRPRCPYKLEPFRGSRESRPPATSTPRNRCQPPSYRPRCRPHAYDRRCSCHHDAVLNSRDLASRSCGNRLPAR